MRLAILAGAVAAAGLVFTGSTARADATNFGKSGQLAISWDQPLATATLDYAGAGAAGAAVSPPTSITPLSFEYTTISNVGSGTWFGLAPAADYFVADNISIGGQLIFGVGSTSPSGGGQGTSTTLFGIAPQVGYNLGITDNITFWPKLSFAYINTSESNSGPSTNGGVLGIYAPFLYHPAPHFFLGLGPNFGTLLFENESQGGQSASASNKPLTFGLMATIGGYFLGGS